MSIKKIRMMTAGFLGLTAFFAASVASAAPDWPDSPDSKDTLGAAPPSLQSTAEPKPMRSEPIFYLSASMNEGVATLSDSSQSGISTNGSQTELMLLGSLVLPNWVIEGGGGWFSSSLNGQAQSATIALQSYSLVTAGGMAELSPQYRLTDHLQIGPVGEALFGTDVSFGASIGAGTQDLAMLGGAQALYGFNLSAASLKLGARYLASLDLPGEILQSIQATLQIGLPIF